MVILYSYLKDGVNIIACIPFRYNIGDENTLEAREVVLEVGSTTTYDEIKQKLLEILDKEKQEYGKESTDEFTSGMPGVVTIQ